MITKVRYSFTQLNDQTHNIYFHRNYVKRAPRFNMDHQSILQENHWMKKFSSTLKKLLRQNRHQDAYELLDDMLRYKISSENIQKFKESIERSQSEYERSKLRWAKRAKSQPHVIPKKREIKPKTIYVEDFEINEREKQELIKLQREMILPLLDRREDREEGELDDFFDFPKQKSIQNKSPTSRKKKPKKKRKISAPSH